MGKPYELQCWQVQYTRNAPEPISDPEVLALMLIQMERVALF